MDATTVLMIANLLFFALYVTATLLTRRSYGELRGSLWFASSNALRGAVMLAFLVRSPNPPELLSLITNATVLLGFLALHRAFAELLGEAQRLWRTQLAVTCGGIAVMVGVIAAGGPYAWFLAAMSLAMCAILGLTAAMLIGHNRLTSKRSPEGFTAALLAGYGVLALWRTVDALCGHADWGSAHLEWHMVMWLLGSLVVNGGTAFGFVLIASVELARQLEARAQTDALTGLRNRHGLEALMASINADPKVKVLSAIAFDIDNMKAANDRWGHEFGDEILRRVAAKLLASLRHQDTGLRLGGDEFLIVLPGTAATEAARLAERLRLELREILAEPAHTNRVCGLQGSFGVATLPAKPPPWDALLRSADQAMYCAKQEGRDRVHVA